VHADGESARFIKIIKQGIILGSGLQEIPNICFLLHRLCRTPLLSALFFDHPVHTLLQSQLLLFQSTLLLSTFENGMGPSARAICMCLCAFLKNKIKRSCYRRRAVAHVYANASFMASQTRAEGVSSPFGGVCTARRLPRPSLSRPGGRGQTRAA